MITRDRHELLRHAIEIWGDALCAWCLGVSFERLDELRDMGTPVPAVLERPLEYLVTAAEQLPTAGERHPLRAAATIAGRLAIPNAAEETPLNLLRLASGGELPTIAEDDGLLAPLQWLARDLLPAYLLLEAASGGPDLEPELLGLGRGLLFDDAGHHHPASEAFAAAFATDERMKPLRDVTEQESPLVRELTGTSSSGSAYLKSELLPDALLVSADTLARNLVEAAWERQRRTGRPDVHTAIDGLDPLLAQLSDGLAGKRITAPAVVGLRGLAVDDGAAEIAVQKGRLRAPTRGEHFYADEGEGVGLVLEVEVEGTLTAAADVEWRLDSWARPPYHELLARGEGVALAVALADLGAKAPAASVAWAAVLGPLGEAHPLHHEAGRVNEPLMLDVRKRGELAAWIKRVRAAGSQLPDVALRRSITALHGRRFYADGLVDAVIALESLVGRGSPVRLAAAVAWLLAPDSLDARKQLFQQVDDLYRARSGVVHDGRRVVGTEWLSAVSLLRRVLRALLTTHDHLLTEKQRGDLLLLGGGHPAAALSTDAKDPS